MANERRLPSLSSIDDTNAVSQEDLVNFAEEIGDALPCTDIHFDYSQVETSNCGTVEQNNANTTDNRVHSRDVSQESTSNCIDVARGHVSQGSASLEVNDRDVLFGRGGGINKHPGNQRFRQIALSFQSTYKNAPSKAKKTEISKSIVELVHNYGGRFLEKDKDTSKWEEVNSNRARIKASQLLR